MNTAAIRGEWTGHVIDGRFTLLQWLGGTEASGVYLTEMPGFEREKAAVKLIAADAVDAGALIAGWGAAANLAHPHLMRLFDTGRCQIDGAPLLYIVTEYADEVLSQVLPERPLTPDETKEMLVPVLDTLSYLHERGFVHGRLKPSNILVVGDRLMLSADCLQVSGQRRMYLQPLSVYDAPESAGGSLTPAADMWSLGATLIEALTQHPPSQDRRAASVPEVPGFVPQPFAGIAQECLRPDPARRCSVAEIKARLEPVRPLPEPAGEIDRVSPTPTVPGKLRSTAIVAVTLVALTVAAALLVQSHESPPSNRSPSQPETSAGMAGSQDSRAPAAGGSLVKGAVADRVLPDVLPSAMRTIRDKVDVGIRAAVDRNGAVSSATFESHGPSHYFADRALDAAQRWRFKPAEIDGRAVSSVWILQFEFRQTGIEVTPAEVSP